MSRANHSAGESFPSTAWECVRGAAADAELFGRLLAVYRGPLVEFLTRKGTSPEDAEDTVQQFLADRVIGSTAFLERADASRGRFRAYLRTAVWHFWIDRQRSALGERASPNRARPLAGDEVAPDDPAAEAFDVALALRLFSLAVQRLRVSCESSPEQWGVFEGRALTLAAGGRPTPYAELAIRWRFKTEKHAANAFQTVQYRFRRHWGEVLDEHFGADGAEETDGLIEALGRAGPDLFAALGGHLWEGLPDVTHTEPCDRFPAQLTAMMKSLPIPTGDAGAAMRAALSTPLWIDADGPSPIAETGAGVGGVLSSLCDLFRASDPGLERLMLVKDYAKTLRGDSSGGVSPDVASVLYYLAIAAAFIRYRVRISDLDDRRFRAGLEWVAARSWIEDEWRATVTAALTSFGGC